MSAHNPAEWAAVLSLGVGVHGAFSVPYFLLVNASRTDFDPRPAMHRAVESGRFDPALIAVANVKHDACLAAGRVRRAPRDAAISAAALLMILTGPTGDAR